MNRRVEFRATSDEQYDELHADPGQIEEEGSQSKGVQSKNESGVIHSRDPAQYPGTFRLTRWRARA